MGKVDRRAGHIGAGIATGQAGCGSWGGNRNCSLSIEARNQARVGMMRGINMALGQPLEHARSGNT